MTDDELIYFGAVVFTAAGIISGAKMSSQTGAEMAALTLGHSRSPTVVGLVGAQVAYPGRTAVVEGSIRAKIEKERVETFDTDLDALACIVCKLLDRRIP